MSCISELQPFQSVMAPFFRVRPRSIMRWLDEPRNCSEISFSDSTNLPSTRTSASASISSVHSHRQCSVEHQLIIGKSRKYPDVLVRVFFFYSAHEREKNALVLRLEGLSAEKREPVDVRRREHLKYLVFGIFRERLSEAEIPCLRLEAALTAVRAARDKERYPYSRAVCDIIIFYFTVVHSMSIMKAA